MESESSILPDKSDNSTLKECWNGGKRASQLNIDMEATELLLSKLMFYISVIYSYFIYFYYFRSLKREVESLY